MDWRRPTPGTGLQHADTKNRRRNPGRFKRARTVNSDFALSEVGRGGRNGRRWHGAADVVRRGTRAGATAIRRSCAVRIASALIRPGRPGCEQWEGQGAARQVLGAMAIHSGRPSGSSPGAGDLLRRVLGRVGPGCSTSFRRRDRGLCVVLLPPSSSVLARTAERHRR
jgi:hypothetical protein